MENGILLFCLDHFKESSNLPFDIFETPNIFIFLKDLSSLKASTNS